MAIDPRPRLSRQQSIAYQMMRGSYGPQRVTSKRAVNQFFSRHQELVNWMEDNLPRIGSRRCSTAVGAVLAKCILFYGRERIEPMIETFRTMNFKGADDPAHVLWLWLLKNKKDVNESYRMAVTACLAYCEGRTLDTLRPAVLDIFDWDKTFTTILPAQPPKKERAKRAKKAKSKKVKKTKEQPAEISDEQVAREVAEALPGAT